MPQKEQARVGLERERQLDEQNKKVDFRIKLENCIANATNDYQSWLSKLQEFQKERCKNTNVCGELVGQEIDKAEKKLQQDKENCFKRYPQN